MDVRRRRDARHLRELQLVRSHERAVGDFRIAARRGRGAVGRPAIHVEQERLHRPSVVERVVALLADRLRWRESCGPVLSGRQEVDPHVVHERRVARAVDRRVDERRGAPPVLVLRVRVEHLRQQLRRSRVRQQSIGGARFRIFLDRVRKWKDVGRVEEVQIRMAIPRRLREPVIEAAAAGPRDMGDHTVEHLAIALVSIEPVVQVRAQEAAALRNAESDRACDRRRRNP